MPNTYSQLYVQIVFAVKFRHKSITEEHRDELEKYITGIITNKKQKVLAIYMMPDHLHILINYKPDISLSELVKEIKRSSSLFVNEKKWFSNKFQWQEGFGAFSYSIKDIDNVIKYIMNQKEHHKQESFKKEYLDLLISYEIEYNPQYLFEWNEQ